MAVRLTAAEMKAIELTVELWNGYLQMLLIDGQEHPNEREEMARDVHCIQQRIMARLARRAHPEVFR